MDPSSPFYKARQASFLSSSIAPFTPFGPSLLRKKDQMGWRLKNYGLTVQGSQANGSRFMGWQLQKTGCTNIWQVVRKPLWRMTHVVLWLVFISNQSVASSSVHFSYKFQSLPFLFLHFQLKHIVRAQPSSLSDQPVHIVIKTFNTFPPFTWFIRHRFRKLVSVLFQKVLLISLFLLIS